MENNLLSVWGTIGSVLLAILILLMMITVHEFGHYLVGKILKFKIDEFSIGFGPAIFKKKRKKSDELFAIRLIPLGGYCAFAGEDELEEERKEKKKRKRKKKGAMPEDDSSDEPFGELKEKPVEDGSDTILITPVPEERKDEGTPSGEVTEVAAENTPLVPEGEAPSAAPASEDAASPSVQSRAPEIKADDGLFTHKKPWQRILVLFAGAFMNYLLALLLIIILLGSYGQSLVKVGGVSPSEDYPAEYSFRADDILISLNGKDLYVTTDLYYGLNGKKQGDIVKFEVFRKQEDGSYRRETAEIMLRGDVTVKNSTDYSTVWPALGIGIEERGESRYYMIGSTYHRFGFFETIGRSFMYSFKIAGTIFRVIGELFTGRIGLNALGGPVTTITTTSQVVSSNGFRGFLEIAAFIGVNLAVVNLMPIPALDGSKIVFTIIEWIRKKPISRKVEAIIHLVGIVLLFGFAVLVDILQFV